MNLGPGSVLGSYHIVEEVGRGGMARVYRAYQPTLERFVALKVLADFYATQEGFKARFRQEAVAVGKLRHPNIPTVIDHGEQDGLLYIVSEFVEGGTLASRLGSPGSLDELVQVLQPIAAALDYAHQRGLVHRDVKPANIMFTAEGTPVLTDFGLARMMEADGQLTASGSVLGTPDYMPPETCAGQSAGPRGDQYSLAVVAYQVLTGRLPFQEASAVAMLVAHVQRPVPSPCDVRPDLPLEVERALLRGLAKSPDERFPRCGDLVRALAAGAAGAGAGLPAGGEGEAQRPGPANAPTAPLRREGAALAMAAAPTARLPRRPGRRRWLVAVIAVIALAILLGGSLLVGSSRLSGAGSDTQAPPDSGPSAAPSVPASPHTDPIDRIPVEHGARVYQANLDGSNKNVAKLTPLGGDADQSVAYGSDGMLITVKHNGGIRAQFDTTRRHDYVAQMDLRFNPGSDVEGHWLLRDALDKEPFWLYLELDPVNETLTVHQWPTNSTADPTLVGDLVKVPGLGSGQQVTVTVRAVGDQIDVYLGAKRVVSASAAGSNAAVVPDLQVAGHEGSAVIRGVRVYAPAP